MKKLIILSAIVHIFLMVPCFFYGQEDESSEKVILIREAKQVRQNIVAVEAYRIGEILEVKIKARMYSERPRIKNVLIVGPRLGRLSYKRKEELTLEFEEDKPFPTTKKGGFISFGKKKKTKQPEGTLTQELFRFQFPWEKIVPKKRYQLWVDIESKTRGGDRPMKFRFDLEKIHDIIPAKSN